MLGMKSLLVMPWSFHAIIGGIFLGVAYSIYRYRGIDRPIRGFPVARHPIRKPVKNPKESWMRHGRDMVWDALEYYNSPFQVITSTGPKLILPNRYADEIRNHPDLSHIQAVSRDFFPTYSGFQGCKVPKDERFLAEVVRVKLTQSLGLIISDLVEETTAGVHDVFGEDKNWHTTKLKQDILYLIPRLSSRIFLGTEICRNSRWLEIARDYTMDVFICMHTLRALPAFIRPIAHCFLPISRKLRKDYNDGDRLIQPEVKRRIEAVKKRQEAGVRAPRKTADLIGWIYDMASERREEVDYTAAQMGFTLAATHTTSEAVVKAMLDLVAHPEIIEPLRAEIIDVMGKSGWSRNSLYSLRLLDSFLKESQRCDAGAATLARYAKRPITLSDGTVIPAGSSLMTASNHRDPTIYAEPEKFDAYRFYRARAQPGQENSWQHVTTADSSFLVFGYGEHACPGRFFASNEIKILLVYMVMRYDWKVVEGQEKTQFTFEQVIMTSPEVQIQLRRREEEELDLDGLVKAVV